MTDCAITQLQRYGCSEIESSRNPGSDSERIGHLYIAAGAFMHYLCWWYLDCWVPFTCRPWLYLVTFDTNKCLVCPVVIVLSCVQHSLTDDHIHSNPTPTSILNRNMQRERSSYIRRSAIYILTKLRMRTGTGTGNYNYCMLALSLVPRPFSYAHN